MQNVEIAFGNRYRDIVVKRFRPVNDAVAFDVRVDQRAVPDGMMFGYSGQVPSVDDPVNNNGNKY